MINITSMSPYAGAEAALAVMPVKGKAPAWYTCREDFHQTLSRYRAGHSILFKTTKGDNVIKFLNEAEKRLKLPKDKCCRILGTNLPNVICVEPNWWAEQRMRTSLLTILLRVGRNYTDNFTAALYSMPYTTHTKQAVERFFRGHTKYIGTRAMWIAAFRNNNGLALVKEDEYFSPSDKSLAEAKEILSIGERQAATLVLAMTLDRLKK